MHPRRTNRLAQLSGEPYDNDSHEESLSTITEQGAFNIHVLSDERYLVS